MQLFHLLALSGHTHRSRPRDLFLTIAGFALAAVVLAILLSVPSGLQQSAAKTGRPDVVMALSASSFDEASSTLTPQQIQILSNLPHVARGTDGQPLIAPQLLGTTKISDGTQVRSVQVRGVDQQTWKVMGFSDDPFNVIRPGSRDILAGAMVGSDVGGGRQKTTSVRIRNNDWHLAGRMDRAGSLWDSEFWGDLSTLQADYQSQSTWSVALLRLDRAENFQRLENAVRQDPRLREVRIVRQDYYYRAHTKWLASLLYKATVAVSIILGTGAVLAIGNALGTSFRGRRRESGTLRALGFRSTSVAASAIIEVLIIGALTCALSLIVLFLTLDGHQFAASSGGHSMFATLNFDSQVLASVFIYTLLLGLVASLLPVWRMSFGNLVDALRAE